MKDHGVTTSQRRPVPVPDDFSAPYWANCAQHVLSIARCARCDRYAHPAGAVCQCCGSTEPNFHFHPVSGHGTVCSWTIVRQALLPGFAADVPYRIVDVELDDQADLRMTGRLMDGLDIPIRLGMPVHVVFEDIGGGVSVPAFALGRKP